MVSLLEEALLAPEEKTAYHLLDLQCSGQTSSYSPRLLRKSKWHPHYFTISSKNHFVSLSISRSSREHGLLGLDFNPAGEYLATTNMYDLYLISDLNTESCSFHLDLDDEIKGNSYFQINSSL